MATTSGWQDERQFGRTIGLILMVLGGWFAYRGRFGAVAPAMVGIGALLASLSFVWPRVLFWPNRGWMALAEALAFVSSRVILGAVFTLIVTPIGAVMRLTRWDPLQRRSRRQGTRWVPYSARQQDPKHYERMF